MKCNLGFIYDKYILEDIRNKVEIFPLINYEDLADYLISYVSRHYNINNGYVTPKISNFYRKHKKFTRFILISISIFCDPSSTIKKFENYKFNELLKWEVEHIVPQNQKYNKFSIKNSKLKNILGNLTILTKETNSKISNKSFFKKCKGIKDCEKELLVNEIFSHPKVNFSKYDICLREKQLNKLIFEIFYRDNGKVLKLKLKEYYDKF